MKASGSHPEIRPPIALVAGTPIVLKRLRLTVAMVALLLVLLGASVLVNLQRLNDAEKWHTHSYEVLLENDALNHQVDSMRGRAHNFMLTGDSRYLTEMHAAEHNFAVHIEGEKLLTLDRPEMLPLLTELEKTERHWAQIYLRPIELAGSRYKSTSPVVNITELSDVTLRARKDLAVMRHDIQEINRQERGFLQVRQRRQEFIQRTITWILGLGAMILTIVVGSLSIALMARVGDLSMANKKLQNEMLQRELAQREILESQLIFHAFMDNNPTAAFMKDADSRLTYVNRPMERLFTPNGGELVGQADIEWLSPEVAELIAATDRVVLEAQKPCELTVRIPTADGVLRTWLMLEFPLSNRHDEQLIGGVAIDITEREAAAIELKLSRGALSALIENTRDWIWSVDTGYHIITFNEAFSKILHYRLGVWPEHGMDWIALLKDDIRELWKGYCDRALAGEHFSIENHMMMDGEEVDHEVSFNPIMTDGDVSGIAIYSRDITERRKVDRMKSEFISTVSHELRTPLTSIRGALGLVAGGIGGEIPKEARHLVDIALSNSERLVRLINDILDIEKIESGNMRFDPNPVPLVALLLESIESNRAYAQRLSVSLKMENSLPVSEEPLKIFVDNDRLAQIMANLISNAAKFSAPGSEVVVSAGLAPGADASQSRVRVAVRDHGTGVPEEFRQRIFQKFAQADSSDSRRSGGTGLGLSISKAIIQNFGGDIDFISSEAGSTFFFDLPIWRDTCPVAEAVAPGPAGTGRARFLICEHDALVARKLAEKLGRLGFDSEFATDAEQARTQAGSGRFAAMTLDLSLPGGEGIALIRALRRDRRTQDLPIVVVSALAEDGREELVGDAIGVVDWLEKPIDDNRLVAAVNKVAALYPTRRSRILHVEDDPDIIKVVGSLLHGKGELAWARSLKAARDKLAEGGFDLVILDIGLPDGSGLELLPDLYHSKEPVSVVIFSARELVDSDTRAVAATLIKSRTSNQQLLDAIGKLIRVPVTATIS